MKKPLLNRLSWLLLLITTDLVHGQEESLRSALNAINRRQRFLSDYRDNFEYGYPLERPQDINFIKTAYPSYVDDNREDFNNMEKQISSAFRERVEEDNQKQMDELADNIITNMDPNGPFSNNDKDYNELVNELYGKYKRPLAKYSKELKKRFVYPRFGMDSIGLRKRSRYPDGGYPLPNPNRDDIFMGNEDEDDNQMQYLGNPNYVTDNDLNVVRQMYLSPYSKVKSFPVAKRSSDFNYKDKDALYFTKRSSIDKHTDPKVQKDLSIIFDLDKVASTTVAPDNVLSKTETKTPDSNDKPSKGKEILPSVAGVGDKPLQIKKKSVDWSDYFGLDRRKKSDVNDTDKEWLIEKYHKSVEMSADKRNSETPMATYKNPRDNKDGLDSFDDKKIDGIGLEFKKIEDKIIDETLKYTGAHEGETDPKEIQDVKEKVISHLAAAYSLEKMRNALDDYKKAVNRERERLKKKTPEEEEYIFEQKRASVPRKQTNLGTIVPKADNAIKCNSSRRNCHDQSYRIPGEIIENEFGSGECPIIQTACDDIASIVENFGEVFQAACIFHEMCVICNNNNWRPPNKRCNQLFLAKAFDLCKGNPLCHETARRSAKYLVDVNRALFTKSSVTEDCEMTCPEIETLNTR